MLLEFDRAAKELSAFDPHDKKQTEVGRKGVCKAKVYEEEAKIRRLRNILGERMEEERKQKKDNGGRLEEARHEDARLEEAVEQEAEQREPTMIIQKECVDCTLPTAAIIKESTERLNGGLQKHPSSPLKHRTICPACQNCSVKPFQVLKFKQMNDVLRMSQDSGYNYLCLSGKVDITCVPHAVTHYFGMFAIYCVPYHLLNIISYYLSLACF